MRRLSIVLAAVVMLLSACTQVRFVSIEDIIPEWGGDNEQFTVSSDAELRETLLQIQNGDTIFLDGFSINPISAGFTPYEISRNIRISGNLRLSEQASSGRAIMASRADPDNAVIFTVKNTSSAIIDGLTIDIDASLSPEIKAIFEVDTGRIAAASFAIINSSSSEVVAIHLGTHANADTVKGNLQGLMITVDEDNRNKSEIEEAIKENTGAIIAPSVWDGSSNTSWYDPEATEYNIGKAEDLAGLAELVSKNTDFSGKTINLTSDIDLNSIEWTPIGSTTRNGVTTSDYFRGTFDGHNHKIANIYINQTSNTDERVSGLFGVVAEAEIKNLTIESGTITDQGDTAGGIVGAVIDEAGDISKIINCHNNATIYSAQASGGIAGRLYGAGTYTIESCTNSGSVSGGNKVGGITAINHSNADTTIIDCHNTGTISGENDGIGGIIGYANANIRIETATNTGEVKAGRYAGGIVGYTSGNEALTDTYSITDASNSAEISGTSLAGGIIGLAADFEISDVRNSGSVSSAESAGGIAGSMIRVKISNAYNTAAIHGEEFAGGIAGNLQSKTHIDSVSAGTAPITTGDRSSEENNYTGYAGRLFGNLSNSPARSDASYLIVDDDNNDSYENLGTIGIIGPWTSWGGLVIEGGTFHGIPSAGRGLGQFEFLSGADWDGYDIDNPGVFRLSRDINTGETKITPSSWHSE